MAVWYFYALRRGWGDVLRGIVFDPDSTGRKRFTTQVGFGPNQQRSHKLTWLLQFYTQVC